jgi:hypothetical protein
MTDQNSAASTSNGGKAYNVTVTQITDANVGKNSNDKSKVTFRAKGKIGGRDVERTVVAQGAAADLIMGKLGMGNELKLRVLFSRAPSNDDGQRGGEFLTVVGEPLPPKQKAA